MTPEIVKDLYAYDAWANRRTFEACAALTPEQFTQNLGNSFASVRDTLAHIVGAHFVWLERFYGRVPPGLLPVSDFPNIASVTAKVNETQSRLTEYVSGLSAENLRANFAYRDLKGREHSNMRWHVLQHLANHGTYHRGQITTMLRQLAAKPVSTDLIAFYRERTSAATS